MTIKVGENTPKIILGNGIIHTVGNDQYQELEYIESTGSQYINSGVVADSDLRFEIDFSHSSVFSPSSFGAFIGAYKSNGSYYYGLATATSRFSNGEMIIKKDNVDYGVSANIKAANIRQQCSFLGNKYKDPDGVETVISIPEYSVDYNLFIFANDAGGGPWSNSKMKLYSLKLYNQNTLVRNFIPVKKLSDNTIGLLDLVNNVYYSNLGSGNFVEGPIKPNTIYLGETQIQ